MVVVKVDTWKIRMMVADQMLSLFALAGIAGTSRQTISMILRRGSCDLFTAGKLAKALGVPVREIVIPEE